jgi:hypothetical protein
MFAWRLRHILGCQEAKKVANQPASPLSLYPLRT